MMCDVEYMRPNKALRLSPESTNFAANVHLDALVQHNQQVWILQTTE